MSVNSISKVTVPATIKGTLQHPDKSPFNSQNIALCFPHWFKDHQYTTTTNAKGKYAFEVTLEEWDNQESIDAIIKIFHIAFPGEGGGTRVVQEILVKIPLANEVDLGILEAKLFEAQKGLPILDVPQNSSENPILPDKEFIKDIILAAPVEVAKRTLANVLNIKTKTIQNTLFPPRHPEMQLTAATTLDLIRNGICPCNFIKKEGSNELVNVIQFPYEKDGSADLFDVSITVIPKKKGFEIKNIKVKYGEGEKTYLPTSEKFKEGLYLFNSMALVKGEIVHHLGIGHLMVGQLARAFYQHIRNHPIAQFMAPFFRGVQNINNAGSTLIFGPTGVVNLSGESDPGVTANLADVLSAFCYTSDEPAEAMNAKDLFLKAYNLFWRLAGLSVDKLFEEKDCSSHWEEIFLMSESLVNNSLPFKPLEGGPALKGYHWVDKIDTSTDGRRPTQDGKGFHTLRPITLSQNEPEEGAIQKLKRFCQYGRARTFYHWYMHNSQAKWATNLNIASLAPQNRGKGAFGGTKPQDAAHQLAVADVLLDFKADLLLDNPHKDVDPYFLQLIRDHAEEFASYGVDVNKIHLAVTI